MLINEIDVAQLIEMQELNDDYTLVDIRMPGELQQGRIANAQNIPMNQLPANLDMLKQEPRVILYCRSGARSAHACAYLLAQGMDNVAHLRGGIMAWTNQGLPLN
jgi:rhodanese-related sulfurtransferase